MAVINIPTRYRPQTPSTMGLFAKQMQPMLANLFQTMLQQGMWEKREEKQADTRMMERLGERDWRSKEAARKENLIYRQQERERLKYEAWLKKPPVITIEGKKVLIDPQGKTHILKSGKNWGGLLKAKEGDNLPLDTVYQKDSEGKVHILFDPTKGKAPTTVKVYDNVLKKNVRMTHAQILATPNYLKRFGMSEQTMKELRKAGAPEINVGLERFKISKGQTIAGLRQVLSTGKQNKEIFEAQAAEYNRLNKRNEVAYWRTKPTGWVGKKLGVANEQIEFVKIPKSANTTSEEIQAKSITFGVPLEKLLKDLGIID